MKERTFFIFFLFPYLIYGQSRHDDSLATCRYEGLYKSTIYGDKLTAKQALDSLKYIAEQGRYPEAAHYYHFFSGGYYFNVHQLSLSEEHYHQALRIAERLNLPQNAVHSKIWLGNLAFFGKKYSDAARWHNEAYALSKEIGYINGMCDALFGLSSMESDYHKKMELYIQIESLYTQNNEISPVLSNTYEHMGTLYLNTRNDRETAVAYYEKALSIATLTDYSYGITEANKLLGEMALNEGDFERAKGFFEDLYKENLARKDTLNQTHALVQLAEVDRRTKNYAEAENKVLRAIDHYIKKKEAFALTGARLLLAQIYLGMQKPHLSKPHLDYANNHHLNNEDTLAFKIKLLTTEVDYYSALQIFDEALKKQKEIDETKTLQTRLLNEKQFLELETQYRTRQKEDQIELLSAENELAEQKRKNQLAFFGVITVLMAVVGLAVLFAYRNKLRTAQKIKELNEMRSRFFTNISHEFRTPLTLIKSPLQLLQAHLSDEKQQKQLSLIDKSADRMLELVDQLLELSKLDSGDLKLILKEGNIGLFLKSIVGPFEYQANESGFNYASDIEVPTENHQFDKDVIEKIVTNLLSNALKYTPENQRISVRSVVENEALNIHISNSVRGLQKSDLPKIFERFYQNADGQEGFGVGLALVKELVDLYKGAITTTLANEVLTFQITLPLAQHSTENIVVPIEAGNGVREVHHVETEFDHEFPVLLIVDDHAEIRDLLKDIFSESYTVLEAENGKSALKIAQKEIPDCIISDVMMPEMDGFGFTQAIKDNELTSFIPVILLTAKSSEETHLESLKSTADAYLTKPFHNEILKETVIRQISERKKLRERYSRKLILKPLDIAINTVDEKFLEKLGVVMEKHLSDTNFSTDDFASELGMSRMQLHRKLKSLLNVSTTEFIRNERLKTAAELIRKGHNGISEVAYTVGFNDVSYFSKCFKELYGVTPSDYMNNPA